MLFAVKNEAEWFKRTHNYADIAPEEFKEAYERVTTCFFQWLHDPDVIPSEHFECDLDAQIFDDLHQEYLNLW